MINRRLMINNKCKFQNDMQQADTTGVMLSALLAFTAMFSLIVSFLVIFQEMFIDNFPIFQDAWDQMYAEFIEPLFEEDTDLVDEMHEEEGSWLRPETAAGPGDGIAAAGMVMGTAAGVSILTHDNTAHILIPYHLPEMIACVFQWSYVE